MNQKPDGSAITKQLDCEIIMIELRRSKKINLESAVMNSSDDDRSDLPCQTALKSKPNLKPNLTRYDKKNLQLVIIKSVIALINQKPNRP